MSFNDLISAIRPVIPDNTSEALDISSTDAKDYVKISTEDGSEKLTLSGGSHGIQILDAGAVQCTRSGGWALLTATPSATVPNFNPVAGDPDTGIGAAAADQLSLIAGGVEGVRIVEDGGAAVVQFGQDNYDPEIQQSSGSDMGYTFKGDTNTGMSSGGASDTLYLTAGNTQAVYISETSSSATTQINGKALIKGDLADELTGTVSIDGGALNTLIGSGTAFETELFLGASVKVDGQIFSVLSVASNTSAVLDSNASGAVSAGTKIYTDNAPTLEVRSGDSKSMLEVNNHFVRVSGRGGSSGRVPASDDVCLFIDGHNSPSGLSFATAVQINAQGPSGATLLMGSDGTTTGRLLAQSGVFYVATNSTGQDVVLFPGSQKIMSVRGDDRCAALQDSDIKLYQNEASAAGQEICFYKSRNTTDESAATIVNDDDVLGEIKFKGANGDAFSEGARIFARINGTPGNDDLPTELVFCTTPDNAEAAVERMNITHDGKIGIAESAPECALHITGGDSGLSSLRGGTGLLIENSDENGIFLRSAASKEQHVYFANSSENANAGMQFQGSANRLNLLAGANTIASLHNDRLGVKVTDPDSTMEVNGPVHIGGGTFSAASDNDLLFTRAATTGAATVEFRNESGDAGARMFVKISGTKALLMFQEPGGTNQAQIETLTVGTNGRSMGFYVKADGGAITERLKIGSAGEITITSLPTSDPGAAGQLWNDSATVKVSAG